MNRQIIPVRRNPVLRVLKWALWAGLGAIALSCDSGSSGSPPQPRTWYYEHEFQNDPNLAARPDQVVVIDVLPGERQSEHAGIPYHYEKGGGHLFAIPADEPFIDRVEVFDPSGVLVAALERGDGGAYLEMAPGNYSIRVLHDGISAPDQGTVAFIRRQIAGPAPLPAESPPESATSPIDPQHPAYVALKFTGGPYKGQYLAVVEGTVWDRGNAVDVRFMKAVPLAAGSDEFQIRSHLFSFEHAEGSSCNDSFGDYPPFAGSYTLRSWPAEDASQTLVYLPYACNWPLHCPPSQANFFLHGYTSMPGFQSHQTNYLLSVQDNGDGTFVPWFFSFYTKPCSPAYAAENGYVYFSQFAPSAAPGSFSIEPAFRFYKDGGQIDRRGLKGGQVALYEGKDYSGAAVVLNSSLADSAPIPMQQVQSLAFGIYTDTTIRFFSQTGFSGSAKTVGVDMPGNLNLGPGDMRSIQVFDSRKVLVSSKECPNCNLAGVDLSTLNLNDADLFNANLANANLGYAGLQRANLSQALLSGAKLVSANLSGASLAAASLNADSELNLAAATLAA